jgi:phage baseplate assembly protein W
MTLTRAATPIHAIAYPFNVNVGTGKLAEENDYDRYIAQLIRQVLLTAPGERVNRPDFGAGVRRMVFAVNSDDTSAFAKALILEALGKWLGRLINVERIEVRSVDATMIIDVAYLILQRGRRRYLNVEVTI